MSQQTSYVLCFSGGRAINKRMAMFVEGAQQCDMAVRIVALPRGPWILDKSEQPTVTTRRGRLTADIGDVKRCRLASVMCFHWAVLPFAVIAAVLCRVPLLYDEHDHYELNTLEGSGGQWKRRLYSLLVRTIHRFCIPWATVVTCIHLHDGTLRKHLAQWNSNVVEVHNYPAAVWRETRRLASESRRLAFVYIGGVWREKGVGAAAEAFLLLPQHLRQMAELHVFGTGDDSLLDELRRCPDIVVHNGVTPAEFRRFAAAHRCCGLSLLANTPRYSLVGTNCTKLYEYLALGMPVIATNVGEFPQFVASHQIGLIVDSALHAQELSGAMERLISDSALMDIMSRNAAELMQLPDMTWEHEWNKVRQSAVIRNGRRAA